MGSAGGGEGRGRDEKKKGVEPFSITFSENNCVGRSFPEAIT